MRLRAIISAFALTMIVSHTAVATPFKTKGHRVVAKPVANAPVEALRGALSLFTPVTDLPGTIGTVRYNSDGRCLVLVMGGAPTNADLEELLSKEGTPTLPNFIGSHTAYMCPGATGEAVVTLLNYRALRQVYRGSPGSSNPGTALISYWNQPNLLASASLGNRVTERGIRFISNAYDLILGTDNQGEVYFVILDHVSKKLIHFTAQSGGYYSDLSPDMAALYSSTIGTQALLAPKIALFNNN